MAREMSLSSLTDSEFPITLLTLECRYIQHLAGNVLVNLSEFIASSGKSREFLIHSLCICFEFSISSISSAGIIRILGNILKFLKEECDDELVQVFLIWISFSILNVAWDSMDEIFGGNGGEKDELRTVFLGNFIQFLCSLVEQFSFVEELDDSLDKHVILSKIINLVTKLLYWCLGKKGACVNTCMFRYFRYKLLLIHDYFQELLCQPLTEVDDQDDSLENSPFMSSISDGEVHGMHSCHLQRQAIFLFLRCSFSLINLRKDTGMDCPSATVYKFAPLGKSWEFLIHSLCICFEFSISSISSGSFEPSITGVGIQF
ncbi:hypothetical protein CRYUN_Cryun22dG0103300 [Craigia yunnanensis]